MGYDDLKVVEASRLVQSSIAAGKPHRATVEDALATAEIVEAMSESPGVVAG